MNTSASRRFIIAAFLLTAGPASAGGASVTPADTTIGVTTDYTYSFTTPVQLDAGGTFPDEIVLQTGAGGPDFSGVTFNSISGGSLTATLPTRSTTSFNVRIASGSAPAGSTITVSVSNAVNPGTVGAGPDYTIRTVDFAVLPPTIDEQTVPGTVYTSSNLPVVVNPIADRTGPAGLFEGDGAAVIVADLDTVFEDADMDPLSFSVDGNSAPGVATASIDASDALTITPLDSGTTTITIRATSVDGTTTDTFDLQVIGELDNASVVPTNNDAGATTAYSFQFDAVSPLGVDNRILVITGPGGPDWSGANLSSLSGGTLNGTIFSQGTDAFGIDLTGGALADGGTLQFTLSGVVNPGSAGTGPDYLIRVTDFLAVNDIDRVTVPGSLYGAVNIPTVVNPIGNQNLAEIDGVQQIVADLNTVFDEADGDVLSFTIDPGNDAAVATATIDGNALNVTPVGPGTTTISVRASDPDGSAVDAFDVTVLGLMDNAAWAPQDLDSNAVGSWDFDFTTSTALDSNFAIVIENLGAGPDYSGATLGSLTGGSLTAAINGASGSAISIEFSGGTAIVGQAVSIRIDGVTNPASPGADGGYRARLFRLIPSGDVERAELPPTVFTDGGLPVVAAPIADQQLFEADGPALIRDLDGVFQDGNGQTLSYSILPGNDPSVATGVIDGSELTVTPVGPGTTTFSIEASDLPAGGTGTATDSFEVRVIGALANAMVLPATVEVDELTDYTILFDGRSELNVGDRIEFRVLGPAPDLGAASLDLFFGGSGTAVVAGQAADRVELEIDGGAVAAGAPVTILLTGVRNPGVDGPGDAYRIDTRSPTGDLLDRAEVDATVYIDSDLLFRNGFEPSIR